MLAKLFNYLVYVKLLFKIIEKKAIDSINLVLLPQGNIVTRQGRIFCASIE